jgi:hypothetical protein
MVNGQRSKCQTAVVTQACLGLVLVLAAEPVQCAPPGVRRIGSLSIKVKIDKRTGLGKASVIAGPNAKDREGHPLAQGAVAMGPFPIGNRVVHPHGDPYKVGTSGPFPQGQWPIERVEPVSIRASKLRQQYGPYKVRLGRPSDITQRRGTWIHAGRRGYQSMTEGCLRVNQADLEKLVSLVNRNNYVKFQNQASVINPIPRP